MPLPDLIEIVPLKKPVHAGITVPGSKSITNRALVLAALADGETVLGGALWSEDTQVMVDGLVKLGFAVKVEPDPDEVCNRAITVHGLGGKIPNAGTLEKPLELFVGNAGTAARFLATLVCLGHGIYRLDGVKRMRERPQEALFDALRELGYCIDSTNSKLPALVHGSGPKPGAICCVSITESSQFASALLMCAGVGEWQVKVVGENREESPYVVLTSSLVEEFRRQGRVGPRFVQIEPDASSGSYFWGAAWLCHTHSISVRHWPDSDWQMDQKFPNVAPASPILKLPEVMSRETLLGDSIMSAIVLAPFASRHCKFTQLGRLRLQECERVVALRTELTKCGAKVIEEGDTLTVYPSELHGAEIETYNDHRMAMCFAILGLKVPGIKIKNPACVKKTFPNFFQKLAEQPPHGLGATILDAKTGRALTRDELFAE